MNCVTPVHASTDPVDVPRQMCRVSSYETPSQPAFAQSVAERPASFTWRRSLGIPMDVALVIPQPINTKKFILSRASKVGSPTVDVPRQQSVAERPASFTWRRSLGIPVDVALVIPQPVNGKVELQPTENDHKQRILD